MMGKRNAQSSAIQMVTLEELVPPKHFLRKLDQVLDLSFMPGIMKQIYPSELGHPSVDGPLAVRMILLGYLYDLSEVRLCEELGMHAGYRWFCRLDFHEKVPHRTTLVKFRGRCREHGLWEELFHQVVTQCLDVGLLSGRHLMADSTQVQANASIKSMQDIESELTEAADRLCSDEAPADKPEQDDDHHHTDFHGKKFTNKTHRSSTDPDAQFYRKSKGKEAKLSYKAHNLADTKSRVIVATSATRISGDDARDGTQSLALLDRFAERHGITPKTLCADTMYGSAENIASVVARGIQPHIPLLCAEPPAIPVWKRRTYNLDHARKRREKVEQAQALRTASELSTTQGYQLSRKLRHRIEHLFGEAKQSHGLDKARCRGLEKMQEQTTLTATVQNLKRLVKFHDKPPKAAPNKGVVRPKASKLTSFSIFSAFRQLFRLNLRLLRHFTNSISDQFGQPAFQIT